MVSDLLCRQRQSETTAGDRETHARRMKLMTMFTGQNARKGAVYDRTENERNVVDQLVWMPESDLYKGENPFGCHAYNR